MNDFSGHGPLTFSAPAKINLDLHVLGRRPDGYHLLSTLMTFVSWGDRLEFRPGGEGVRFVCHPPLGEDPEDNLALRAARRLHALAAASPGIEIHLHKVLPVAAGLGGGSSDGATVLMVLNRLWRLGLAPAALRQEGLALGADLPFFIGQCAARAEGVGERLTPWPGLPEFFVVLINPGLPLATRDVFRAYAGGLTSTEKAVSIIALLGEKNGCGAPPVNDLQPVSRALVPVVGEMIDALLAAGAWLTAMSGSGPTVFGLFADRATAAGAAARIGSGHGQWAIHCGQTSNTHPFQQEWARQFPDNLPE